MIDIETFRSLALSFDNTEEMPHFEKTSFRVKKKIFATLSFEHHRACIKLSAIDQSVFCSFDNTIIYPVPNKWGKQGWTHLNLKLIRKDLLIDALTTSYLEVSTKKILKVQPNKSA